MTCPRCKSTAGHRDQTPAGRCRDAWHAAAVARERAVFEAWCYQHGYDPHDVDRPRE